MRFLLFAVKAEFERMIFADITNRCEEHKERTLEYCLM